MTLSLTLIKRSLRQLANKAGHFAWANACRFEGGAKFALFDMRSHNVRARHLNANMCGAL